MFADNLILLHWNLRKVGWLQQPEETSFDRTDADFQTFIEQNSSMPSISKQSCQARFASFYLALPQ